MTRYYYSKDGGDVQGPISCDDLSRMHIAGILGGAAQVCAEGSESWQPIANVIVMPTHPQHAPIAAAPTLVITPPNPLLFPIGVILIIAGIALGIYFASSGHSRSKFADEEVMDNIRRGGSNADYREKSAERRRAKSDYNNSLLLAVTLGLGLAGAGAACIVVHNKQQPTLRGCMTQTNRR